MKNESQKEQQAQNKNKALAMLVSLMIPKLLKVLSAQTQEAVRRIAQGQEPIPPDYRTRWAEQLTEAQKPDAVKALHVGWTIGGSRVPNAQAPSIPEEARMPLTGTGDQLSRNDSFAPPVLARLFAYLLMVGKIIADTHARRIQKEYDKLKEVKGSDNKAIGAGVLAKMEKKDKQHADVIAQTNVTWTGNEGLLQRYKAEGVPALQFYTMLDERVCIFCQELHGKIVSIDVPFVGPNMPLTVELPDGTTQTLTAPDWGVAHPPVHVNCVVCESPVWSSDNIAAFVSTYSGIIHYVCTEDGRRLGVTSNHMLLTNKGWVAAKDLRNGDYVVDCGSGEWSFCMDVNQNGGPVIIDEYIQSLAKSSQTFSCVPTTHDLHGDGALMHGNIDIIPINSLLLRNGESTLYKKACESVFLGGGGRISDFTSFCSLNEALLWLGLASDCLMSRSGVSGMFFRGTLSHHDCIRFGLLPNMDIVRTECISDNLAANTKMFCNSVLRNKTGVHRDNRGDVFVGKASANAVNSFFDFDTSFAKKSSSLMLPNTNLFSSLIDRMAGKVKLTQVVNIDVVNHANSPVKVYDLSTSSTVYTVNGVLSSNCRCDLLPVFVNVV